MANPFPQKSKEANDAFHTVFTWFSDATKNADMTTAFKERGILEKNFVDIMKKIPKEYLQNSDFRTAMQDTKGLEPMDSMIFLQAVSAGYRTLGIGVM
jgi:hypothetical protein